MKSIWNPYQENESREHFLERRAHGIGASDAGHLLEVAPYGCLRCLYEEKLGLREAIDNSAMEAGRFYEDIIADLYKKKTGHNVARTGFVYLEDYPHVMASPDRVFEIPGNLIGCLEIKRQGQYAFKKTLKDGPPEMYRIQVQYQMLASGLETADLAIYWPDGHDLRVYEYKRDQMLCLELLALSTYHWNIIKNLRHEKNPKLPNPSKHCTKCVQEVVISGETAEILDKEVEEAMRTYVSLTSSLKEIEDEKDLIKEYLLNKAGNASQLKCGDYSMTKAERKGAMKVSLDILPELTEEQRNKYCGTASYVVTTIKKNKEVKK